MSEAAVERFCFGLLGYPIGHTLSPILHRTGMDSVGIEGDYASFPISPDRLKNDLPDLLGRLRARSLHGLNVTIPYKRDILDWVDVAEDQASVVTAANTLFLRSGNLVAANTDIEGFTRDISRHIDITSHNSAVIIGAGGGARAVAYSLLSREWKVTLVTRNLRTASALIQHLNSNFPAVSIIIMEWDTFFRGSTIPNANLVVNATPIGMMPNLRSSPWPADLPFPPSALAYDLVYNPGVTRFLAQAAAQGLRTVNGAGMLIEQAALALEIWTGASPDREKMRLALNHSLSHSD